MSRVRASNPFGVETVVEFEGGVFVRYEDVGYEISRHEVQWGDSWYEDVPFPHTHVLPPRRDLRRMRTEIGGRAYRYLEVIR